MKEKKFYITEDDLRVAVDDKHKVTVYIMNKSKTAVKSFKSFRAGYPADKIISVNPAEYYEKIKEIEKRHAKMRKDPKYANLLDQVDESEVEEIDVLLAPVRKALGRKDIAYVECDDPISNSNPVWMDSYGNPVKFNFCFNEEVDCVTVGYFPATLGKICTSNPKVLYTIDDMIAYEDELQERYDQHYDAKEGSEIRKKTDELLNF